MKEIYFEASDGKKVACTLWNEVQHPRAVVQIVHGMNEHMGRYGRFADYLNRKGYIVFGDDHRAHGRTAASVPLIGKPDGAKDLFGDTVRDELEILDMLEKTFNLPVILFGFSYGSFIAARCMELTERYAAVCLCGSAKYPGAALFLLKGISRFFCALTSPEAEARFLERFSMRRGGRRWLSRDPEQVKKYEADPYCNKIFSYGFYDSMFKNLSKLHRADPVNKAVPLKILSGGADPVGGKGVFVRALIKRYRSVMPNFSFKLYPGAKHELLNEINYEEVYGDIWNFFESSLKSAGK